MSDPLESQSHIDDYFDLVPESHVNEYRNGDFKVRILESPLVGNEKSVLKWRSKERQPPDEPLPTIGVRELHGRPESAIRVLFPGFDEPNRNNLQGLRDLFETFSFPTVFLKERVQGVANSFGIHSWLHFLSKNIVLVHGADGRPDICGPTPQEHIEAGGPSWIQGAFFMKWNKVGGNILLCCFGSLPSVEKRLKKFVENTENVQTALYDPYALYVIILDELHLQMDKIVWDLLTVYNDVEKHIFEFADAQQKRVSSGYDVDFVRLHHLEKLVIHLKEGCEAVMETAKSIQKAHSDLFKAALEVGVAPHPAIPATDKDLEYLLTSFNATSLRIRSVETRVMNAINLAFNLVIQRDSTLLQSDSQSMKTVALMTLIFLPGTAVATVFGTQFINADFADSPKGKLKVTGDFWLFWVLVAATTGITLIGWRYWLLVDSKNRYSGREKKKKSLINTSMFSMA